MTTIKATCPTCGEVDLTPEQVRLVVCGNGPLSYYGFDCPTCLEDIRKPADEHIVSLLTSGGVRPSVWSIPAEALEPHPGPALGYDDLLDFALQLASDDLLAALAATPVR
ncbi:MAG: hypothetical protein ACYDB7_02780 [Mycobacteriales bacterium]